MSSNLPGFQATLFNSTDEKRIFHKIMTTVFKFLIVVKEEIHSYTKHAEKLKRATQLKKKRNGLLSA